MEYNFNMFKYFKYFYLSRAQLFVTHLTIHAVAKHWLILCPVCDLLQQVK